jgi:hypothetical protein
MQKQDWVNRIQRVLSTDTIFTHKTCEENKAPILFAVDVFRRLNHVVTIHIEPTEFSKACLYITISPNKGYFEFTLRREDNPLQIIETIANHTKATTVSIRGCGTVINSLFTIVDWAIHNGWYVEKTFMSTLTQTITNQQKQRNTTLNIVIQRGSNLDSI